LPEVAAIRRPQPAPSWVFPPLDLKQPAALPVEYVPLGRPVTESRPLAQLIRRHAPQKVAIIAADFNGYEAFVGKQLLPRPLCSISPRSAILICSPILPCRETRLVVGLALRLPCKRRHRPMRCCSCGFRRMHRIRWSNLPM